MTIDTLRQPSVVVVGRLVGAYGVKGWLRVMSFTRPITNILNYKPWLIRQADDLRYLNLLIANTHGKRLVVSVDGVVDRTQALSLVGCEVMIDKVQLPPTQKSEFYWHDLLNLKVFNADNLLLGLVAEIIETVNHDVLVVTNDENRYLIPYVPDVYIKDVDIERGVLCVDWQPSYC